MNYLFQFALIAIITFIGEALNFFIPLPIPASIYGLIILFIALCTKIIKLNQVEKAADFFLTIMPIMFVPPAVNLMTQWDILKSNLISLLLTCLLSTIIVMAVTGLISQALMRRKGETALSPQALEEAEEASDEMLYPEGADNDAADTLFENTSEDKEVR